MEFLCNLNTEEQNSTVFKYQISCNFTVEIPQNHRRNDRRPRRASSTSLNSNFPRSAVVNAEIGH